MSHIRGKERLGAIGESRGYAVLYEVPYECTPELDSPRTYWIDVVLEDKRGARTFLEVDGTIHFKSWKQRTKTDKKTLTLKECHNIHLIRFLVEELVGKYKLTDEEIIERLGIV